MEQMYEDLHSIVLQLTTPAKLSEAHERRRNDHHFCKIAQVSLVNKLTDRGILISWQAIAIRL